MQAWNWGAAATQGGANFVPPQTFAGQVTQMYQSTPAAQTFGGGQIPQTFPAATALVPGQQLLANYQQFYGGAVPTSTEIPAGYTAQQWEAAQQQHFLQWQQWNQQFQQWQQEYGTTYSMAMQGCQQNAPPTSTAEPPPLPPPDKPPPPPDESRVDPKFQVPPPENTNFKGQKRPVEEDHSKFQEPADKKHHGDNSQQLGKEGANSKWGSSTEISAVPNDEEDRSEQEKMFDAQFLSWEEEFFSWKQQNINHPDKNQYLEYEKKWTKWRQELLQRREQMRKKRVASMAKASPDTVASKNKSKADRTGFTDPKINRNLDAFEFHDPNKQQSTCGQDPVAVVHPDGFGFRPGSYNQQQNMTQGGFSSSTESETKNISDMPLQFTGPYPKKGYGGMENDGDLKVGEAGRFGDHQNPQASHPNEQKGMQNTWNQNFHPKMNFNMNQPGTSQQFEQANGASQPPYGNQMNPAGIQNLKPDSDLAKTGKNVMQTNQDFSKDIQLCDNTPQSQKNINSSKESKSTDIVDITADDDEAPNFDFLKKSSVIPGLDLCPDKAGDIQKKGPPNDGSKTETNSSQPQLGSDLHNSRTETSQGQGQFGLNKTGNQGVVAGHGPGLLPPPGQGLMPSPGQGLMPAPGQGLMPTPGQGMMPPPGQGLMPPGFMGNPNMNQWAGGPGGVAQQGFPMNRPPGFQGNMAGYGPFGPVGQMGNPPNEGPGNRNPNYGPGNQGPYMGGPNNGPGTQNSNFSPGNMGTNFTSPGNKSQTMGMGNQNQNMGPGNQNQSMGPGNQNQSMGPGNQNQSMGPGNQNQGMGPGNQNQGMGPGNQNQSVGPGNQHQNQNLGPNFSSPGNKGQNMVSGNQGNNFPPGNRMPNFNNGLGNQGPPMGPGNNPNFGPGNMNQNFNMNMKGPNVMPPNFGPGGQGGPMNMGPSNQNSYGQNASQNFGPGNQNSGPPTGNQGPHFDQMNQFNRSNQGFGNIGPKNVDQPGFMRDQPPPGGPGSGSDHRDWGEMRDGRNQGQNQGPPNWNDNIGPWNQGNSGRDSQNAGPRRDMNQEPTDNFPRDKFPAEAMNQFPPKEGFSDGKQGGLMGSGPTGNEPFNKGLAQGMRDSFPGQDKFSGVRDNFPKDGPNFLPERENFPKDNGDFPDMRERPPTMLAKGDFPDMRERPPPISAKVDRAPTSDPNFRGPHDNFNEGPDFRGQRNHFMDDIDKFQGHADPLGPTRGPVPSDAFPQDIRDDFNRDRFPRRDNFDPIDGPRGGYPDRDFNRGPFRDNFRTRDEAFHSRGVDMDERRYGRDLAMEGRDFEFGRGGPGWDQRGGDRPPYDYYRSRQFGDREDDSYSKWDRTQRPPVWDNTVELEPVTIVEYGHKPAPSTPLLTESSSMLENVQTFDYAHGATPRSAREVIPPAAGTDQWRRDDYYGRESERDRRSYERDGRWEKDRERDRERDRDRSRREDEERSSKHNADDDRYRSRSDDRWGRRSERDNDRDRNGRSRDSKREGDSGRSSKSGPPPSAPPPPSFSGSSESGKGGTPGTETTVSVSSTPAVAPRPILVEDLLSPPGRETRPQRIVIILRGPPGSGKTFVAKLIKDKEVEMGGPPPRILCLDDYFMVEVEKEEKDPETGRKVKVKVMEYEYEAGMEKDYRSSLVKSFKKTVNENYFPFIIVDCVNQQVKNFEEMWSYAKQKGFQVYICEMDMDVSSCSKRNTHNRTEKEIMAIVKGWEETPKYYLRVDVRSLLQSVAITEVEMEDSAPTEEEEKKDEKEKENKNEEEGNEADEDVNICVSKWERMEPSGDKLDRLDGLKRRKLEDKPKTLEDWLQLSNEYDNRETKPGEKMVRWADLEEKREQEKMRAIGFVVGQTDWSRMTDPTFGESALTQTKYI